jgi:hypothetical protein
VLKRLTTTLDEKGGQLLFLCKAIICDLTISDPEFGSYYGFSKTNVTENLESLNFDYGAHNGEFSRCKEMMEDLPNL